MCAVGYFDCCPFDDRVSSFDWPRPRWAPPYLQVTPSTFITQADMEIEANRLRKKLEEAQNKLKENTSMPECKDNHIQIHNDICNDLHELYVRKNHDYGDSFHKTFLEEGFAMTRIRLADKFERFKTLSRGEKQKVDDESIEDTLMDLANYAIMTIVEMKRMEKNDI